ncbi:hypothetical protein HD806DRAFT_515848 [Xylariaceae sp. AK1471]|nr:hypothetical protein HD806DRAFT_515848 [Xylariaceae sp. AK1471]
MHFGLKAAFGLALASCLLQFARMTFSDWFLTPTKSPPLFQIDRNVAFTDESISEGIIPTKPTELKLLIEICDVHDVLSCVGSGGGGGIRLHNHEGEGIEKPTDFTSPATGFYNIFNVDSATQPHDILHSVMKVIMNVHRQIEAKGASQHHRQLAGGITRAGEVLVDGDTRHVYDAWIQPVVKSAQTWESERQKEHHGNGGGTGGVDDQGQLWTEYRQQNGADWQQICRLAQMVDQARSEDDE